MEYQDAKQEFIMTWGSLGSNWGINRTMAQIHALLLISPNALSADEIMAELQVSRGNANMNLRALIDWKLIRKELVPGERKDFFVAEKDIYKVAMLILKKRREQEIAPLKSSLQSLESIEGGGAEAQHMSDMISQIQGFVSSTEGAIDQLLKADQNWFFQTFLKVMLKR